MKKYFNDIYSYIYLMITVKYVIKDIFKYLVLNIGQLTVECGHLHCSLLFFYFFPTQLITHVVVPPQY